MSFSLYDASVPVFSRGLTTLSRLLDKARAEGFAEATLMAARLHPDMRPLPAQIQLASDTAKGAAARLAGVEAPAMADDEIDFVQLQARLDRTRTFIEGVDPATFVGAETRPVTVRTPGGALHFLGAGYLTSFALPNFQFHVTTAYAILRQAGVPLGKLDFLGPLDLVEPSERG